MEKEKYDKEKKDNISESLSHSLSPGRKPDPKRITVSSISQQQEEMYLYWSNLTPIQRLQHVYEIHKNLYGTEVVISTKKIGNRIHFDQK